MSNKQKTPIRQGPNKADWVEMCEKAGVKNTARQWSKFQNGYGAVARSVGKNLRKDPTKV